jgi:hypothetical protein
MLVPDELLALADIDPEFEKVEGLESSVIFHTIEPKGNADITFW